MHVARPHLRGLYPTLFTTARYQGVIARLWNVTSFLFPSPALLHTRSAIFCLRNALLLLSYPGLRSSWSSPGPPTVGYQVSLSICVGNCQSCSTFLARPTFGLRYHGTSIRAPRIITPFQTKPSWLSCAKRKHVSLSMPPQPRPEIGCILGRILPRQPGLPGYQVATQGRDRIHGG